MQLKLLLPVPTSINALYINQWGYDHKLKRNAPTGAKILSKEGEKCKEQIQFHTQKQLEGQEWDYEWTVDKNNFMYMDVWIYFSRRGRDSDNIFKLLSDSLEKLVYDNDSRVLPRVQRVLYDTKNPRIQVEFSPVDYIGIFRNSEEIDEFESRCKTCTRYLDGRCSILNDSLIGTVREEIGDVDDPNCTAYKEKK